MVVYRILRLVILPLLVICLPKTAVAQTDIRLLLTSNIQGRSTLQTEKQDREDPLLLLAQNIVAEKRAGADLYIDLGNGFYPGIISKFSSGSIMMDFFDYLDCAATLVSSRDLQIDLQNLEFLQRRRNVQLLSANIQRPTGPVFSPYILEEIKGVPVAFLGLSSNQLEFDIAEKDLYGTELAEEESALEAIMQELAAAGVHHIILLSGLQLDRTLQILGKYQRIDLALCGGDYTGDLYDSHINRVDLADGRAIVMLDRSIDYGIVDLSLDDRITLAAVASKKASPRRVFSSAYLAFRNRMSLWKEKYLAEQHQRIAQTDEKEYLLDDQRLLHLMRDQFNGEIAVVEENTVNPYPIKGDISQSDLLHLVNLDYNLFTFQITGDQVSRIVSVQNEYALVIGGMIPGEKISLQGYPLESKRSYRVVATQSALKKINRILGRDIASRNSWKTVTDILTEDLANGKVILRDDYAYLDKRFRILIDMYLSNFIASGDVERHENIETPVNQPEKNFDKWGLDNKIDLTLYNRYHRFVLTPYIIYSSLNDNYVQNLLQGTLLYEYNLSDTLKPYNKLQCDSVVEEIDDKRPVVIRETIGVSLYGEYVNGKIGLGLEKKIQDPAEDSLYGIETIFSFTFPFLEDLTYRFDVDNFVSSRTPEIGGWGIRSEIRNMLSMQFNTFLSVSLNHKYFYLFEDELDQDYRSSQIFTALDLKTDWKIW